MTINTARKGILLAGGTGTRLHPLTLTTSKQMLPVYDKPMIYYPLSVLMLAGIKDILVISTPRHLKGFEQLLGDGRNWGVNLSYAPQPRPEGIAQALIIAEKFLNGSPATLALGDNIFFGHGLRDLLERAATRPVGATVLGYNVRDPRRYGVVSFDDKGRALEIEEKPAHPKSSWAVTGLYFYDTRAVDFAKNLKPSPRGELEITDLNREYLKRGELHVEKVGRGYAWLDAGTPESMLDAAHFIQVVQERQGQLICCPEEVAYTMGFIDDEKMLQLADALKGATYGRYLRELVHEKNPNGFVSG